VRINRELPQTATTKILKRELIGAGVTAAGGVLWERAGGGAVYVVAD
jgi:fatty-acyl-CoA synthase